MKVNLLPKMVCLVTTLAVVALAPALLGQAESGSDQPSSDTSKSWNSRTEQQNPAANVNPTRTRETHSESGTHAVDKQVVERLGPDGRYEPYLDVEKESVKVNATTVRTIERTFGRDPSGQKTLIQQTEQETHTLPGGGQKAVRTTSNPDANGRLEIVNREIQETRQVSSGVRETNTTMLNPDVNGGFTPVMRTQHRETRNNDHVVEFQKSTLVPDGNGNWQVSEVRQGVVKEESNKSRTKEERILRPDLEGKLAVAEHTVSKESETALGEKRGTVETYSTRLPGASEDGSLHLNQRVTTVRRLRSSGGQVTEEQVEQRNPAAPNDSVRVTQKTIDIVRPTTGGGAEKQRTILSTDSTGSLGVVWVDTTKTAGTPAVKIDTATPPKPK
jgi:hypothetical protein